MDCCYDVITRGGPGGSTNNATPGPSGNAALLNPAGQKAWAETAFIAAALEGQTAPEDAGLGSGAGDAGSMMALLSNLSKRVTLLEEKVGL